MKIYESWLRAHLPPEVADESLDLFGSEYLDGLTVMQEGERGGDDTVVYAARDEEDLRYWQLRHVCMFIREKGPLPRKVFRYDRDHAENGQWFYTEHRHYDYDAIDDARIYGFEKYLRLLKTGYPPKLWEEEVRTYVRLMNYWYRESHWDYDREKLCFIEVSHSKEHDYSGGIEEPRPGSVIKIVD